MTAVRSQGSLLALVGGHPQKEFMMLGAPAATGLAVLDMAQAGRFAEIRDLFAPQLRPIVPAGAGMVVVKIPVTCERGALTGEATDTLRRTPSR